MEWSFRYERTLSFSSTAISVLQFSHDFTKLISGNGSGDIKVWDVSQWSELKTLRPAQADRKDFCPRCVSIAPSGALACCYPKLICVYSAQYELVLELQPPQDLGVATWRCLCFSPTRAVDETMGESGEDNLLVAWTETSLCVYPVQSTSVVPRFTRSVIHTSAAPRVGSFTRCGTRVVCGHEDGQIYVWNVSSFTLEKTLVGHLGAVTTLDFSVPDSEHHSMMVSCSLDKTLRIWEAKERGWQLAFFLSVALVHDHQPVRSCQFSPDGMFFVTCGMELVVWKWLPQRYFDDGGGPPLIPHQKLKGCMDGMRLRVVAAGAGQVVVGSIDGVLGVWSRVHEEPPVQEQLVKQQEHIEQKDSNHPLDAWQTRAMCEIVPESPKKLDILSPNHRRSPDSSRKPRKQSRIQMYKVTENPMFVVQKIMEQHKGCMRRISDSPALLAPVSPCRTLTPTRLQKSPSLPTMSVARASSCSLPAKFQDSNGPVYVTQGGNSQSLFANHVASQQLPSPTCQITRPNIPRQMRRVTLDPMVLDGETEKKA